QVIDQVLRTVDPDRFLAGKVSTGGRLNAYRAVSAVLPDVTGPRVVAALPNASGASPVSRVRLTFSEGINASTFTTSDATLTGPQGAVVVRSIVPVYNSDDRQFDVVFDQQSAAGTYTLVVGPDIRDWAGNPMDQNGNGINGEAGKDADSIPFTIASVLTFTNTTPATVPDLGKAISPITINQDLTIGDLNVKLNVTHTFDHDLYIHLVAPDGTDVVLVNRRGDAGHNFTDTVFHDDAPTPIGLASAPF